jgi:signal transduction histidine kinase
MLAWLLVAASGQALAAQGLVAAAYLHDRDGSMTLQQAQAAPGWTPSADMLGLGFLPFPVWLRLETPKHAAGTALRIRIRPAYLDEVRLFVPQPGGAYLERVAGDRWPFNRREHSDTALSFDWPAGLAEVPTPIYLRVLTTSSMTVYAEVLTVAEAEDKRDFEKSLFGVYLGVMAVTLVWGTWRAIAGRDLVFALFSLYQASSMALSIGLLGYASRYLFPQDAGGDTFTSSAVLMVSLIAVIFHRYFLKGFSPPRGSLAMLDLMLGICLLNIGFFLAGQTQLALKTNALVVVTCSGLMLFPLALTARPNADRISNQLRIGYGLLSLFVLLTMLPLIGLIKAGQWSLYLTNLHSLMTAAVLGTLVAQRRQQIDAQARSDAENLIASRAEALQIRIDHDEKERFLAMLTHELRTPLSLIRMVLGGSSGAEAPTDRHKQFAHQAIDDINSIIERCMQTDQFERGALQQRLDAYELQALALAVVADHPAGQRLEVHVEPDLPIVKADALLVKTVLSNLIDNALKYSPELSVVTLRLQTQSRDQMPGILVRLHNLPNRAGRPDPQRVFHKYYRSAGAHASSGSGLGLFLVAGVARMFGGAVVYRADLPDVCFEFWLPTSGLLSAGPSLPALQATVGNARRSH